MRAVTGKPIRFVGVGEKLEALEEFNPERVAGRILGMGDIVALVEKAQETIEADQAAKMMKRFQKGQFSMNDLKLQLEQMIKMGAINEVRRFLKLKVKKDKSVNKAIGIHEIKEYLEKGKDMRDVIEKISIKTRQYAKRQSTWARGNMRSWLKLPPQDLNKFLKKKLNSSF